MRAKVLDQSSIEVLKCAAHPYGIPRMTGRPFQVEPDYLPPAAKRISCAASSAGRDRKGEGPPGIAIASAPSCSRAAFDEYTAETTRSSEQRIYADGPLGHSRSGVTSWVIRHCCGRSFPAAATATSGS